MALNQTTVPSKEQLPRSSLVLAFRKLAHDREEAWRMKMESVFYFVFVLAFVLGLTHWGQLCYFVCSYAQFFLLVYKRNTKNSLRKKKSICVYAL